MLPLFGCAKEEPEGTTYTTYPYTEYPEPVFTPGTLESDLLTVQNGNYERTNRTGGTIYLEVESGFYTIIDGVLCYADRADMDNWVAVCTDPSCMHSSNSDCTAVIESVFQKDNRLYFLADGDRYSYLCPEYKGMSATVLCSMAFDGTDIRAEHVIEDALMSNGGVCSARLFPNGYALGVMRLTQDGSYRAELFRFDYTDGEQKLLEINDADGTNTTLVFTVIANSWFGMGGDVALSTCMTGNVVPNDICWVHNGETVITDVSEFPMFGSYLSGNILRCYKSNYGYYDIDLLTGEETRLADAQLANGHVRIFQPNCIFESTLPFTSLCSSQLPEGEAHKLRFFDGQQWHDVALPEELQSFTGNQHLGGTALTSDSVMFITVVDGQYRYYSMALDAEEYKLEPCGTFSVS